MFGSTWVALMLFHLVPKNDLIPCIQRIKDAFGTKREAPD
jgi:hypothetical protein